MAKNTNKITKDAVGFYFSLNVDSMINMMGRMNCALLPRIDNLTLVCSIKEC